MSRINTPVLFPRRRTSWTDHAESPLNESTADLLSDTIPFSVFMTQARTRPEEPIEESELEPQAIMEHAELQPTGNLENSNLDQAQNSGQSPNRDPEGENADRYNSQYNSLEEQHSTQAEYDSVICQYS